MLEVLDARVVYADPDFAVLDAPATAENLEALTKRNTSLNPGPSSGRPSGGGDADDEDLCPAQRRAALVERLRHAMDDVLRHERVHFAGHSNGGFMSYRMACDHADVVASIGSLAGATYADPADCTPVTPVHVLQIHGTNDATIGYNGGTIPLGGTYPGALQTVESWATYNGCSTVPDLSQPPLDLDAGIPGAESTVSLYEAECSPSGSARLWTIPTL